MGEVNSVGMRVYLQTVMLPMTESGLSSYPQGALAMYPEAAYEMANIPEDCAIILGCLLGIQRKKMLSTVLMLVVSL